MKIKLQKGVQYKSKVPYYASFRVGDVVRICNVKNLKKYQNSTEPYMNKLAVVVGYSTKSASGPMTFAVRLIESGDEYLLYQYLLKKTGQQIWIPVFEEGDELISKSKKIKGKWMTVTEVLPNQMYKVLSHEDNNEYTLSEKELRMPSQSDLTFKTVEQTLPELIGMF